MTPKLHVWLRGHGGLQAKRLQVPDFGQRLYLILYIYVYIFVSTHNNTYVHVFFTIYTIINIYIIQI